MEWIILFFGISLGVALGVWATSFWSPQHRQNRELELALRQKVAELEAKNLSLEADRYQLKGRLLALQADLARREKQLAALEARQAGVRPAGAALFDFPSDELDVAGGDEGGWLDEDDENSDTPRFRFWNGRPFHFPGQDRTRFNRAGRSDLPASGFTYFPGH